MKKAITLLSGGLDSMVSTAIARRRHRVILALTFDYGQRAAKREIAAARALCRLWKIPHKVIKLPWLAEITNTALVNRKASLPTLTLRNHRTIAPSDHRTSQVWVPNRNAVFINIAAAFAESLGAGFIITGFNKEEAVTFPDNGPKFVRAINEALKHGTLKRLGHPKVISFTQKMTKRDMVAYVVKDNLPLSLCWSCYEGKKRPCGRCESCVRFIAACHSRPVSRYGVNSSGNLVKYTGSPLPAYYTQGQVSWG